MKIKRVLTIFIILSVVFLTGCWSSKEMNTLAITICIGIDKVGNGYLITEQVLNPRAIASKQVTDESPVILYTAEGRDMEETIHRLTTQCPRIIYNDHLRLVVFGEDVARDGIQDILDYFARNNEYRTDFYFIVAKNTTAHEILNALTPLESIPGIYMFNSLKTSSEEWAPTKAVRMIELVNFIIADGNNPVLTGIEITGAENKTGSLDALKYSDVEGKPTYTSLGVFKKDKLVGWLDEDASKGYNYIAGNVKETIGYSYYGDKVKISHEIIRAESAMKVYLANADKPAVDVEIEVICNIGSVEGQFDITREENREILIEIAERKIKLYCEKAIQVAQNEFKTDIFGFGEAIHRKYPKLWGKMKDDWNNEFDNLPVNITVSVKLKQLGQITKPIFIKENE